MNRRVTMLYRIVIAVKITALGVLGLCIVSAAQGEPTIEQGGIIGGYTGAACVQGDYAFINQGTVLTVLDISGDAFGKVASLILGGEPIDIKAEGEHLYLFGANRDSALQIVDISDPLHPSLMGRAAISGSWRGKMHIAGNLVYIAMAESLKVVDVSDAQSPQLLKTFYMPANAIFIKEDKAFIADNDGMRVYDTSQPDTLKELSYFPSGKKDDIVIQGDYAYLAGQRPEFPTAGIHIVNISDPAAPVEASFFATHLENAYYVPDIVAIDGHTLCAGGVSRLFIGDVSDPANPVEHGVLNFENLGGFAMVQTLDVHAPYAYIATGANSTGFFSVNISDPDNPQIENRLQKPWDVMSMFTKGDTLYVASMERLWVYGFGDPKNPVLLGSDTTWTELTRVTVTGQYLFGLRGNQMFVIDVADPANMFQVGVYESANGSLREVSVRDSKAYLLQAGENESKLEIVDVSDFANMTMLKDFPIPGEGRDLFMPAAGGVAYVAYSENASNQGFQIIDVSDTEAPAVLGGSQTQAVPITIWTADSLTFVGSNADTTWFLESFNITTPDAPQRVTGISGPDIITDVMTVDSLVIASLPNGCVHVYDMLTLAYLALGHSPESIYVAAMWFHALNAWGIFTLNGYIYPPTLMFSGSWGLFYMFLHPAMPAAVGDGDMTLDPAAFRLQQNYPNPFNPETRIRFNVKKAGHVQLDVFDLRGRHVARLVNEKKQPGTYEINFDAGMLPSSIYFYRIKMGNFTEMKKMTLMR